MDDMQVVLVGDIERHLRERNRQLYRQLEEERIKSRVLETYVKAIGHYNKVKEYLVGSKK